VGRGDDPRFFASRLKRWSLGVTVAGFGLAWGLVSQNVVGATNHATTGGTAAAPGTPGRAAVPSTDFFGQPGVQPQPFLGGGGSGGGPVVTGGTS
jgi:hypothetical protein